VFIESFILEITLMEQSFFDTNIFVKAFILDEKYPNQSEQCRAIVKDLVYGRKEGYTTIITIIETATVLQRLKVVDRESIALDLLNLIDIEELRIRNKPTLRKALLLFMKGTGKLSLADAYTVAEAQEEGVQSITTFDTDFDQFDTIGMKRVQPNDEN